MSAWNLLVACHAVVALLSLVLGVPQVVRRKGGRAHRRLGRIWAGAMLLTAVTSFGIREIRDGEFSALHVLSVVTLVSVAYGVWQIRRGNVRGHQRSMLGAWFGSIGAFVFAVAVPQRAIPQLVTHDPLVAVGAGLVISALAIGLAAATGQLSRAPRRPRRPRPARTVTPGATAP